MIAAGLTCETKLLLMTVLGGTGHLVLGGDVSGAPFVSCPPNDGESGMVPWQASTSCWPLLRENTAPQAARFSSGGKLCNYVASHR
jgi:hypothetical protein